MSGSTDKTKGKVKEAAGDLTDDDELQREGKADKTSGKAKDALDNVKDKVDDVKDKVTGKD